PILTHLRALVHKGCPETVETIKWGVPAFEHKGPMAGMAAFKQHCTFGFWKESLLTDARTDEPAMGRFGRIASRKDLPPDRTLLSYIRDARRLTAGGTAVRRGRPAPKSPLPEPPYFRAALRKNATALTVYRAFPPGAKRDYVEWVTEAKTEATRDRRVAQAV